MAGDGSSCFGVSCRSLIISAVVDEDDVVKETMMISPWFSCGGFVGVIQKQNSKSNQADGGRTTNFRGDITATTNAQRKFHPSRANNNGDRVNVCWERVIRAERNKVQPIRNPTQAGR